MAISGAWLPHHRAAVRFTACTLAHCGGDLGARRWSQIQRSSRPAVTELGDPQYIGTALTLQTSLGFLLTTISIWLISVLENAVGWRYAFIALAPGPIFGVLSMLRLRGLPEAVKIAHGRR